MLYEIGLKQKQHLGKAAALFDDGRANSTQIVWLAWSKLQYNEETTVKMGFFLFAGVVLGPVSYLYLFIFVSIIIL